MDERSEISRTNDEQKKEQQEEKGLIAFRAFAKTSWKA